MRVLLLGSGGREHALAWKMAQSEHLSKLYIAPGNSGTALLGENVNLSLNDFEGIASFVLSHAVKLVVVGSEEPLVNGIVDFFTQKPELSQVQIVGPSREGAQLEGSKEYAKKFMKKYAIPTAKYLSVTSDNLDEGYRFLEKLSGPYVLKADGLAAGKGVVILTDLEAAKKELQEMLGGKFGQAGATVVIEEFLDGIELSVFILTDGKSYKILPEAKDYKRIGEGDEGLNTGGMGAISPVPFADEVFMQKVEQDIIRPTVRGLQEDNVDYKGFIFIGLIRCGDDPYVIEYNVRMGDPETEVVMLRMKSDLLDLFDGLAHQNLSTKDLHCDARSASTVFLVSQGYPESYATGKEILGLNNLKNVIPFYAGVRQEGEKIFTAGGRVLALSAYGDTLREALDNSYRAAKAIEFEGKVFRSDIGFDVQPD